MPHLLWGTRQRCGVIASCHPPPRWYVTTSGGTEVPSQKLWMTTTRRVASARRIVRVRTVVPPRVNVSRLAVLRLTRSVVETLPATSLDPLDCSFSGSFAAQSSRPPTSDNVRYVAFNSKNRLDIRTNTKTVAESLMSIHRNGLGRFPPCPPVFPVVVSGGTQQNHGEHGRTRGRGSADRSRDTLEPDRSWGCG